MKNDIANTLTKRPLKISDGLKKLRELFSDFMGIDQKRKHGLVIFGLILVVSLAILGALLSGKVLRTDRNTPPDEREQPAESVKPETKEEKDKKFLDEASDTIEFSLWDGDKYLQNIEDLESFIDKNPDNARAKALLGQAYLSYIHDSFDQSTINDLLDKANTLLDEALVDDPTDIDALHSKFNYYSGSKKTAKAQETYNELKRLYPDSLRVLAIEGRLANRSLNYTKAIEIEDLVLSKNPNRMEKNYALEVKKFALQKLGRLDEVENVYQLIVENSRDPWDYQSYSLFLAKDRKKYLKAAEVMEQGLFIGDFPAGRITLQGAYLEYGRQLYHSGKFEEGIRYMEKAVEAYPADCGCGALDDIASYFRAYSVIKGDDTYKNRAKEVLDLKRNPKI